MIRQLRIVAGPDTGKVFDLPASGSVMIGRANDTFTRLTDRSTSAYHCLLEIKGDAVHATNSSKSGTLVNGEPISRRELRETDVIRLGKTGETRLVLELLEARPETVIHGNTALTVTAPVLALPAFPSAGDRPIVVECKCGQILQARKQFAGTRVRCPGCGDFLHLSGKFPIAQPHQPTASPRVERRRPVPAWAATVKQKAPRGFLGEVLRYCLFFAVLIAALLASVAGMVFNQTAEPPAADQSKPEPSPKHPAKSPASQPPR